MANKILKVGIASMPPFVIERQGRYLGFEIELWEMIAKNIGVDFKYEIHNFQELIPLIVNKKLDIAFASITINEEREDLVDFSHPTFDSGLAILLSKNRRNIAFGDTIKTFLTQGYRQLIKPLLALLLIIYILGNILFFLERGGEVISLKYLPGALQATWILLCSMLGLDGAMYVYSVSMWSGRILVAVGQFIGLAFLGLLVGELTAFITNRKMRLNINSPQELKGKTVATVKETTSEIILRGLGAVVQPVSRIEEAYKKLKTNKVEAVVFDAPILTYFSINDGSSWAEVSGELFDRQEYGFAMSEGRALRKNINIALLNIKESGAYNALYRKWFGDRGNV